MKYSDLQFKMLKREIRKTDLNIKIISGSMLPLIKIGDTVSVEACSYYEKFDIIVYHALDKRLICHFIWDKSTINHNFFLTQSLTASRLDLPVQESQILGKVSNKEMSFKYKVIFLLKKKFPKTYLFLGFK